MNTDGQNLNRFFFGSVADRLAAAEALYERLKKPLLQDQDIRKRMRQLDSAGQLLAEHMEKMAMPALCARCAATSEGGCCSHVMAGNSDAILLLINMLAGIAIVRGPDSAECCFLGPSGCTLAIKPIFCLNYNCSHIVDQADAADLARLERLTGRLLTVQTELENDILKRIRSRGNP